MKPIDWSRKVANPEAFGEAEKQHWVRVEPLLVNVVDELWKADKIETVFEDGKKSAFVSSIQKVDDFGAVYNTLLHLTDSRELAARFEQATSKFGFDEEKIIMDFVFVAIGLTVLKIELFKLVLLFHLKDVNSFSVADFTPTMVRTAPHSWPKLKPFVDSPLRNALAHGTYAIINQKIVLYQDAKLEPLEEMELASFIMRAKTQDVLFNCLINVLKDKSLYALGL